MFKVVTIVGARPQFVKCAVVSPHLRKFAAEVLVHTGQHYDSNLSGIFFHELRIPMPHYNLGVGSGLAGCQTGKMLHLSEEVLLKEKPDCVLLYGDTNSTLAGALAASKLGIPIVHIEAGLRSFNRRMPEEINRIITDHVSSILFCPTETAVKNLGREGITRGVYLVGDVMYDALLAHAEFAARSSSVLQRLNLHPKRYLLVTVHRTENTTQIKNLECIVDALIELVRSGETVVFPAHPRTRERLERIGTDEELSNLRIVDPVSYLDMLVLEKNAKIILTDSGGVQKEAYWFSIPCVTIRKETEWVETVESGWNVLARANRRSITSAVKTYEVKTKACPQHAEDGHAAERLVKILEEKVESLSYPIQDGRAAEGLVKTLKEEVETL
jgi:UDP-GlcNAc3NAcA epimerase